MSRKGLKVLETIGNDYPKLIDFVVTERDSNVQEDYHDAIRQTCNQFNIACYDRKDDYNVASRYAIVVSWRWMIQSTSTQLIVFHDSLLPKYRGFNPLVSCLINGERKIGVTALFAADEYDAGDIIAQSASEISYPTKIESAIDLILNNYAELATEIIGTIANGLKLVGRKQDESQASYSLWRDEEDYRIDWSQSAEKIRRMIDAVGFPYKGASTLLNDRLVRITEAEEVEDVAIENRTNGKVIFVKDGFPIVVCGKGLLKITALFDDETKESLLPLKNFRTRFK
jgi:methionyl-tRNA formyltransferase